MDNILWDSKEFIPELGCFLKWLYGNPNEQVDKIFSMSAFQFFQKNEYNDETGYANYHEYQKYAEYLEISVKAIIENTRDWYIRIYIDESILNVENPDVVLWDQKIKLFMTMPRVQIICVKMPLYYHNDTRTHQGLLPVMFRYLALFDKNLSIILFRDIDNIWTEQHYYLVENWLNGGGEDIFLFMNEKYKRQQIESLTKDGVILQDKYYTTILSGLCSIRKSKGEFIPYSVWHKMFSYIESYTDFVMLDEYKTYKYYGVRFTYGFDELMLTRILLPLLLDMGKSVYAIPFKIYEESYIANLYDKPILRKFQKMLTLPENIEILRSISINNYWHMNTTNAGLSQYILCILTSIYFKLITEKNSFYKNDTFINAIKYEIYPVPLLMGIGLFTFKNYARYKWYPDGSNVFKKFIYTNKRISIDEFTANSDLSNNGDGPDPDPYKSI